MLRQQRIKEGVTVPRDNLTCPAERMVGEDGRSKGQKLRRSLRLPPEDQDDDDILY